MSPRARCPCPPAPAAVPRQRARTAEEAEAFKEEILAQTAERQSQKAAVLVERQGRTGRAALGSGMAQCQGAAAPGLAVSTVPAWGCSAAAGTRTPTHATYTHTRRRPAHTCRRPAHTCRWRITQAERDREEAEKAELRARVLERSRCEMKLDKVTKRLIKNLQVRAR